MADHYQLEDGSGNYQLEDGTGAYLLEDLMATRFVFNPLAAEFPATNFPQLQLVNRRPVLSFDTTTQETCQWTGITPQGFTLAATAIVSYIMASATTGGIRFEALLEAVTSGDATDLDAVDSFDAANGASDAAVPSTAGHMEQLSIALTNADSIAAADYFRLLLRRAPAHADDTAAGDCHILAVELRDSL